MNPITIKFGTDGWRAIIAKEFTTDNVARVAYATAQWLKERYEEPKAVLGHDCRFGGPMFTEVTAKVLCENGVKVYMAEGFVSTPMLSLGALKYDAGVGVVSTASHNPPEDCGFKVRDPFGGAIPPHNLKKIEALIPDSVSDVKRMRLDDAMTDGTVQMFDAGDAYMAQIGRLIDVEPIKKAGYNVLVDCMWGNGAGWFPRLVSGAEDWGRVIDFWKR